MTRQDWMLLGVAVAFVISIFIMGWQIDQQVTEDTELVIATLEHQAENTRNRAIAVNVLTITCLARLPVEERTDVNLDACIREGLAVPNTLPVLPDSHP